MIRLRNAWPGGIRGGPVPITDIIPNLSPRIVQVLEKLLDRRREDRFQTAAEAALALETLTHADATVALGGEPALQPVADALVAEPAHSNGAGWTTGLPPSPTDNPPSMTSKPWFRAGSVLFGRPRMIAFLLVVFEIIVFATAFALGYLFAIRPGAGG